MPKISDEDLKEFYQEVGIVTSSVAKTLAQMLLKDDVSTECVVFGLLKVAAFVATSAECPEQAFMKLADTAFKDENEKEKEDAKVKQQLSN